MFTERILWIPLAMILLAINISITTRLLSWKPGNTWAIERQNHTFIDDDYPTWWNIPVGSAEMTFEETVHYPVDGPSAADEWHSTRAWNSHAGYVRLGPEMRMFTISMIHEIHCVDTLRRGLVNRADPMVDVHHFQHCLTYLRQFFLCSADAALEPYDFLPRDYQKERVGQTRQCRDWSAVYDALDDNWKQWVIYWRQYEHNKTSDIQ